MAVEIRVTAQGDDTYAIGLYEGRSHTRHIVTVDPTFADDLTTGRVDTETLLRRSFEFLLEHEPKEAILARFDLQVIARYFPRYEAEMRRRLARS
jgi:hypothetical protein